MCCISWTFKSWMVFCFRGFDRPLTPWALDPERCPWTSWRFHSYHRYASKLALTMCCVRPKCFWPAQLIWLLCSRLMPADHTWVNVWGQRRRLPQLRTKFGERAFSHAGPAAWNSLPEHRPEPAIDVFMKHFHLAFKLYWQYRFIQGGQQVSHYRMIKNHTNCVKACQWD